LDFCPDTVEEKPRYLEALGNIMKLTVIGCSDAFGSGGRLQTCYHVGLSDQQVLIDCGATTLIGLAREGLDPNAITTIFLSHLHGDHFAGLVWWMLHAKHVSKRTAVLTVVGPEGTEERYRTASEALFPGSGTMDLPFALRFETHRNEVAASVSGISVTPFLVSHPSGADPFALRLEANGKVIAFSGDTEWVENLLPCANGADLFIAECFGFEAGARFHMNWHVLSENLARLSARRIMLTHMGPEMLANRNIVKDDRVVLADDGLVIDV
jgi:ribonuclease BN (tRNA processing enzyme)